MTQSHIRWRVSELHPYALTLDDQLLSDGQVCSDAILHSIKGLSLPPKIRNLRCVAPINALTDVLVGAGFAQVGLTKIVDVALPSGFEAPASGLDFQWVQPGATVDWRAWYAAHWASYQRNHRTNPAIDLGEAKYEALFGDDLEDALFAYRDGQFIGFSSLRPQQELGWIDLCDPLGETSDLAAILAATLRRATAFGWARAELEVDDEHKSLWSIAETLMDCLQQQFVIWQQPVNAG